MVLKNAVSDLRFNNLNKSSLQSPSFTLKTTPSHVVKTLVMTTSQQSPRLHHILVANQLHSIGNPRI